MATTDSYSYIGEVNVAADLLLDHVVENNQISIHDTLAFARLHTTISEDSYPSLVSRLQELGVHITDLDNYEEINVIEEMQSRENGFVRDNSQIYMVDVSKKDLLDPQQEIKFASAMNESMSRVLAHLISFQPVASQVMDWFARYQTQGQLTGVISGDLLPADDQAILKKRTESNSRPKTTGLEKIIDHQRNLGRIRRFKLAYSQHFELPKKSRTESSAAQLAESFRIFRFTTDRYDELIAIFEQIASDVQANLSRLRELLGNSDQESTDTDKLLLSLLNSDSIETDRSISIHPKSPLFSRRAPELERIRRTLNRLANDCQLDLEDLLGLINLVESERQNYNEQLHKLVEGNLRLVITIARSHSAQEIQLLELVQEGNLGLIKAARKYDYTQGFKFANYATWWVREAIVNAVNNLPRTVHLPKKLIQSIRILTKVQSTLTQEYGREPTIGEIAQRSGLTTKQVRDALLYSQHTVSLETPAGDEESDQEIIDLLVSEGIPTPEEVATKEGLRQAVDMSLADLTSREAQILTLRYGISRQDGMSVSEVAQELGISSDRVRQISQNAMRKLKQPQFTSRLQPYL